MAKLMVERDYSVLRREEKVLFAVVERLTLAKG